MAIITRHKIGESSDSQAYMFKLAPGTSLEMPLPIKIVLYSAKAILTVICGPSYHR